MSVQTTGTSVVKSFLAIITVGLVIAFMVSGGGILLPFMSIPWYVWAFVIFIFVIWLVRR